MSELTGNEQDRLAGGHGGPDHATGRAGGSGHGGSGHGGSGALADGRDILADLRAAYAQDLDPSQRSALTSWLAFTTTFGGVRIITHAIRSGRGPFRNLSVGGEHLHHYIWGILGLSMVGAVAVRGDRAAVQHPLVATAYGSSLGLIVDEFALLLDLKDVYWQKQGRISVDVGTTTIGAAGVYFTAVPLARQFARRRQARK